MAGVFQHMADVALRKIARGVGALHYRLVHAGRKPFAPGSAPVPYAGRVYDADDMATLLDASLDFWLTAGRFARQFEESLARWLGTGRCILTNSGSSANLLAVSALTSPTLGERRLMPGDEVVTVACAFPTTVAPIVQNRLVPVFVDVDPEMYNARPEDIEAAISPKTKAILLAHTLGNPFNLAAVGRIAEKHRLWLIEDNCDALGSRYRGKFTGTFGDIATFSFYPAHHMTMGEGGALAVRDPKLVRLICSFRDWGRDCWCEAGHDNSCGRRFEWQLGQLPYGYDHKYIYSHLGYNLKATDLQAAVGVAQLKKLPSFIEARRRNWRRLFEGLKPLEEFFILPRATEGSDPCWFGFLLTVREGAPFTRNEMVIHLDQQKVATRTLFSGNAIRHPAFEGVSYRVAGSLAHTDRIMNDTFWIGVYPGLTDPMLSFMIETITRFVRERLPAGRQGTSAPRKREP